MIFLSLLKCLLQVFLFPQLIACNVLFLLFSNAICVNSRFAIIELFFGHKIKYFLLPSNFELDHAFFEPLKHELISGKRLSLLIFGSRQAVDTSVLVEWINHLSSTGYSFDLHLLGSSRDLPLGSLPSKVTILRHSLLTSNQVKSVLEAVDFALFPYKSGLSLRSGVLATCLFCGIPSYALKGRLTDASMQNIPGLYLQSHDDKFDTSHFLSLVNNSTLYLQASSAMRHHYYEPRSVRIIRELLS